MIPAFNIGIGPPEMSFGTCALFTKVISGFNQRRLAVDGLISNIWNYFHFEMKYGPKYLMKPIQRLAKATGLSQSTLRRKLKKNDPVEKVVIDVHDTRKKATVPRPRKLDSFDENVVRQTIYDLYKKSMSVSTPRLHQILKDKGLDVCLSTVLRTVKRLGFRFAKAGSGRRFVAERADIVAQRHSYLRKIKEYRGEGRRIVYLDETWLNTNHAVKGEWVEYPSTSTSALEPPCENAGRIIPSGKGSRLIILDAGSSLSGLIPGCSLVFESKTSSQDYHDEMNAEHFTEWFRDTLIPRLEPSSVIVMDNAPYHSQLDPAFKAPTSGAKKAEIQAWLGRNGINYNNDMIKADLVRLVHQNKPRPRYIIDDLAQRHGHHVLRLPPYHCELNPIELIWARLKGFVARNNSSFKKSDVLNLFNQARSAVNREEWIAVEEHVKKKVEAKLWEIGGIQDRDISPVVISFDSDSNSEECDSDDSVSNADIVGTDLVEDATDDQDDDDDVPCCICCQRNPPNFRGKQVSWFFCETCEGWTHDKCSKESRKDNCCLRCWKILTNQS